MINEYVYCPRLAYIEWVEGEFRDNYYTVDGRLTHRRVDRRAGHLPARASPPPEGGEEKERSDPAPAGPTLHARSVELSAPIAGIVARIDLIESDGTRATPVEYKRGKPPANAERSYYPERAQLCAQAIVLEENGLSCQEGVLYYAAARTRVTVPITPELRALTLQAAEQLRALPAASQPPPPLVDSPKCVGCSLAGLCLPDELNLHPDPEQQSTPVRLLFPARDDAKPLHLQEQWGKLGIESGNLLRVSTRDAEPYQVRLRDVSQVAVYGNVQVTTQALRALATKGIPLTLFSYGGWFYGMLTGLTHRNVLLRECQFSAARDGGRALAVARSLVAQKIRNQRTMLRRNRRAELRNALVDLQRDLDHAMVAPSVESLLGIEGTAARTYFQSFADMLREPLNGAFDFKGRNRRPPRDPVNALLSFAYALLVKDWTLALTAVGFDPHLGFYHRPRYGRPSLALDLMEPFRPLIADSVVLVALNTKVVAEDDFSRGVGAVALKDAARRRFIEAYERRMNELVTHPVFGYRISYRRVLEVQARLFARYLVGELPEMPVFVTR
ncbi:MAG: CRISPR-associated endonuclease Cas1 [Proteobacteria bacterium]|nr:CRISPR-associated endonuclease Cas1 [Pseudomonadota bacterium]